MNSSWHIYLIGFAAQGLFSARIIVQWLMSEKARKVVSPTIFWVLSLIASYAFFIYGWLREDFSILLGQLISYFIYIWNIGKKGGWVRLKPALRYSLLAILTATPAVALCAMACNWESVSQTLLKNENIPLWMVIFGSAGQIIFTCRFIYQWLYSRRKGESLLPAGFWIISLIGSAVIVSYGILRHDWVLILGQSVGFVSYTRNLILWKRNTRF